MVLRLTTRIQKSLIGVLVVEIIKVISMALAKLVDTLQGGSDKSEVADFLNSWNRLGRARPKTTMLRGKGGKEAEFPQ